ncbi:MAG: DNA translocase FtsK [Chloroflexi bacterium]|nr:DNA translocase FtsK [Chloroflexota bacterium]
MPDLPGWQLAGTSLIAVALVGLLALTWPEGPIFPQVARFFTHWIGWLAGLGLLWIGAVGIVVVAPQARQQRWVWAKLVETGMLAVGVLVLDAIEGSRAYGQVGYALATSLTRLLGHGATTTVMVAAVVGSGVAAVGIRSDQIWSWGRSVAALTWGGACLTVGATSFLLHRLVAWLERRRASEASGSPRVTTGASAHTPVVSGDLAVLELAAAGSTWKAPPVGILASRRPPEPSDGNLREQARVIEDTLASFNIGARVLEINQGPAVTQFGIEPAQGVPVSRIMARVNDLALRLGATPIRMEAPVPGRRMLGVEVPNARVSLVGLREILESDVFARTKAQIPLALGRDIAGKPVVADLARMPHLLIAGATGSGKSVAINSMVACLLSQFTPDQLQLVMVDPKMVELTGYNGIPHLRMPVVTEMDRIVGTLKWVGHEMERRYKLFAAHSQRNIDGFNQHVRRLGERPLPYIVVIIDELADLMMTAPDEAEKTICRLAQLARATGIHLVVATQRPSVDVVTGLIKANFPSRIAFAVTSQIDSRVILDMVGAERLLGRGDMLYLPPDASKLVRVQGTYVAEEEIEALAAYWRQLGAPQYDGQDLEDVENLGRPVDPAVDDLYERAVELAQQTRRMSVSLLQRRLGIGYPRAARLVDLLEERGIIASAEDGRTREVLVQGELPPPE